MTSRKYKFLTLAEKVKILETRNDKNMSCCQLGDKPKPQKLFVNLQSADTLTSVPSFTGHSQKTDTSH